MNKSISIKNNSLIQEDVENFLNPDYIYIPFYDTDNILVSVGKKVLKEEAIIERKNEIVYSSVSGKFIGTTESTYFDNKEGKCIVIENDFKEKVIDKKGAVKYISEYSKEEVFSLIKKYSICSKVINNGAKIMVINGIDQDPYERTYSFLINNHCQKILEVIDALASILNISTTILAINNHDNNNVVMLTNHIGTYPNIKLKLLPDAYPSGYKELVIKNTLTKKQANEGYIYMTVEDMYNIYNVLKRRKPITEKLLTLSGNSIENSKVLNVKIGTIIPDIIENCCDIVNDKYFVIKNGLIAGKTLTHLNQPITSNMRSLFLNTKSKDIERKCINCGLCNAKCPVGLNPKYLKEHKNADRSKCIGCGLCTYICPSKINFKPYLGGKDE
ncbi:MAG: 4Fe-4S binding protein [Bacilli bacterium]|nr:4Fe-4S binding protein [Bacilli bacterium]